MRPTAPVALVLAIGLVAAACGGDEATPKPVDQATPAPVGTTTGEVLNQDAAESPVMQVEAAQSAEPELAKKAAQTSEDDPDATYGLVSGRYRFAWDTPSDDSPEACDRVELAIVQQDGDFEWVKGSTSARFNATVNDLPEGIYKLEQREPGCEVWQLRIDWMTN